MMFSILALLPLGVAFAAPVLNAPRGANVIPNKYIAILHESADDTLLDSTISTVTGMLGAPSVKHRYSMGSFRGFSFTDNLGLISAISDIAHIDFIEPDTIMKINYNATEMSAQALTTQSGAPWGLSRISHRSSDSSSSYVYDTSAGSGTYIYGIDTGIYTGHSDFGGRATLGANFIDGESGTDGNGHGTHTAATAGGTKYGVAKKASLIAVKVLDSDGSGSNSGVIAGINWAANDVSNKGRAGKAVGNMSLGGPATSAKSTNKAAAAAVSKGLFLAVAAGNDGANASGYEPASEPTVCTVGAVDINNKWASFSNYGSLVDILAPGVNVLSAWIGSTTATNTISGTSMATPHIAGLAAYLLTLEGSRSPADLCDRIKALATSNAISGVPSGTTNKLGYNGAA